MDQSDLIFAIRCTWHRLSLGTKVYLKSVFQLWGISACFYYWIKYTSKKRSNLYEKPHLIYFGYGPSHVHPFAQTQKISFLNHGSKGEWCYPRPTPSNTGAGLPLWSQVSVQGANFEAWCWVQQVDLMRLGTGNPAPIKCSKDAFEVSAVNNHNISTKLT